MTDSDSYQGLLGGGTQQPPAAPVPPTPPIPGPPPAPAPGPAAPRQQETASERTQVLRLEIDEDAAVDQAQTLPPTPWGVPSEPPQPPAADPRSFFDRPGGASGPLPRVEDHVVPSGGVSPQSGWSQPAAARPQHAQPAPSVGPQGGRAPQSAPQTQWGAADGAHTQNSHGVGEGLHVPLPPRKVKPPRPQQGWQRVVSALFFGKLNLAPGAKEQAELEDIALTRSQPTGTYRIAVIGGDAGTTAVASALGSTFANKRGDKVLAIDGTQKIGNLLDRVEGGAQIRARGNVKTLLDSLRSISAAAGAADKDEPVAVGLSAMTGHMAQNPERLFALGANPRSDAKPLSAADYAYLQGPLNYHFNLVLIDVGDHLRDPATQAVLRSADAAILATSSTLDGANHAHRLVEWLKGNGFETLVKRTVAVISETDREPSAVKADAIADALLEAGVRQTVEVPFDPHVKFGAEISLPQLM